MPSKKDVQSSTHAAHFPTSHAPCNVPVTAPAAPSAHSAGARQRLDQDKWRPTQTYSNHEGVSKRDQVRHPRCETLFIFVPFKLSSHIAFGSIVDQHAVVKSVKTHQGEELRTERE